MKPLPAWLAITGALFLAATLVLAISQAPLGSTVFFACAAAAAAAYIAILARMRREITVSPRIVTAAVLLSLAFRVPLIVPPVNFDNDMLRSLAVLFGAAFIVRFIILEGLYARDGSLAKRLLTTLVEGASLGAIQYEPVGAATGYIAFVTLTLYM